MITKLFGPTTRLALLERYSAFAPANVIPGGIKPARNNERSFVILGLVLCAHLTVFAMLRPQSQSLPVPIPQTIEVSLVSTPRALPQKPKPPVMPAQKVQEPIKKAIKKPAKSIPPKIIHKTPVSKPVVPLKQHTIPAIATPVEPISKPATEAGSTLAKSAAIAAANKTAAAANESYQPARFNAAYLHNPAPVYPLRSRRLGEQGRVLIHVQVTAEGTVQSVSLQKGSGSARLDEAALEAVKKWKFIPAKRGQQSVSASVVVPITFSIEG
jgi:protein TonB